jgi:CHASE2 domain-containing sensor protein
MILSLIAILAAGPAHALVDTPVPIQLVLIDTRTTFKLGPLPWPRDRHAKMVDLLSEAGARAIALRFYYRDSHGDAGDKKLVEAVRKSGRVFVEIGKTVDPESWQPDAAWITTMALKTSGAPPRGADSLTGRIAGALFKSPALLSIQNAQLPYEELARAVRGIGSIDVIVDSDKKLKAIPLLIRYKGEIFPSLGMRLFLAISGMDAEPLVFENKESMILGGKKIKLDQYGCILVNLSSPGSGYQTHSFVDVLEGKVNPRKFKDSIVIVGASSPELDVETATGPKNGLELVADQMATLFSFTGKAGR